MWFLCIILQLFFIKCLTTPVTFEDCGSAYDLQIVTIEGCSFRLPCHITLGEKVSVKLIFFADFVSRQLDQHVTIRINSINTRTSVTPEPCDTVQCPVRNGAITSFTSFLLVPANMALNQRGYLQWRVYNELGLQVLCYSVLVQTQNYLQKLIRHYTTNVNCSTTTNNFDVEQ